MAITQLSGFVKSVSGSRVEIEILRSDLPEAYRVRSILPVANASRCSVLVPCSGESPVLGSQVVVILEEKPGIPPIFWTGLFPCVIFGGLFFFFLSLTKNWMPAFIVVTILLFPYYSFLWLLRQSWSRRFSFSLKSSRSGA